MPSGGAVAAMEIDGGGGRAAPPWSSFRRTWADGSGFLVWEDLTAVLPISSADQPLRKLLNGLNGYAVPGRILAIMGPSGSGKSTLLDSLSGRVSSNVLLTGSILLNGRQRRMDYGVVAYVTQENVFLGTLTVRETIAYSARLRVPAKEVKPLVESTLEEMGLVDCADHPIGNWHLRGISGGEKKRLAIALEILTRPPLLFLDEPTTGLDSASAYFVGLTLRQMAREGLTVVASVHQPSSEVFALFDDLCLLSGGEAVYFGDAKLATEFFAQVGFRCPSRRNPSDHFLRCVNSDFDHVNATLKGSLQIRNKEVAISSDPLANMSTTEIKAMLIGRYKTSEYAKIVQERIDEITAVRSLPLNSVKGSEANWFKQLFTLTKRSTLNMVRDFGYYWLRIVVYIIVSIAVGTIFFDIGNSYNSIMARAACGGFISGFMTFMSIGGFPSFIEEMKVFYYERRNGHYGVAVYILSNFFSSFPFLFVMCLCTAAITYNMAKFRSGFMYWAYSALLLLASIASIESLMMIIASIVPNFVMGIVTGAGVMGIMMMTSGFFRNLNQLPKPVWRYPMSYISYGSWALQGSYKNDLLGMVFEPREEGQQKVSGKDALIGDYGISLRWSKWWDLAVIVFLVVVYRIIFYLVVKFNESIAPKIRQLYNRATVHRLKKKSSFFQKSSLISSI